MMTTPADHPEATPPTAPCWRRYVAVGDSFTEGLEDPVPGQPDRFAGWADRLALSLESSCPGIEYANLAIRGKLLAQVVDEQLPVAAAMSPDLVSFVAGANDLLRPRADVDALAAAVETAIIPLRKAEADVLLVTHTDPGHAAFFGRLRGRYAVYTSHLRSIADRHGCRLADLWDMPLFRDSRLWAPDRLHMSAEGHRLLAHAAASALGLHLPPAPSLPPRLPHQRPSGLGRRRRNAEWVGRHLAPWVVRRVTGKSSGALVAAKRPHPASLADAPLPVLD